MKLDIDINNYVEHSSKNNNAAKSLDILVLARTFNIIIYKVQHDYFQIYG